MTNCSSKRALTEHVSNNNRRVNVN